MNREILDYVEDIIDAMQKAELLLEDVTYEQFESDFRIHFAVVRALEIVGEATKRLPMPLRDAYPNIPWKAMAGMRDRLIHAYDAVNLEIVWKTVKDRLPIVRPQIEQILVDYSE